MFGARTEFVVAFFCGWINYRKLHDDLLTAILYIIITKIINCDIAHRKYRAEYCIALKQIIYI